ncbi:MAG TPA: glycoside hydrolase family 3 N-terminal domain-containing protein, partial [Xylella sp.]
MLFATATATTATELTPEQHATALVAQMTREEKIAQAMNAAPAIPRLGIPAYDWWSEGLHGIARNGYATVFPQAIGLAASWNTDLLLHIGTVTSTEARAKFNLAGGPGKDHTRYEGLTLWSPNINIFRDPRWGRGMETYGEDPYLTSQLAVSFIHGLQGDTPDHPRTIATPKHLAVHSGPEPGRHGFDVDVSAYDLEDTYIPAFRAAIVDGHAGSVMCAYNALHGTPACAADWLTNRRIRGDWGFKGFIVSDCDAIDDMTRFHFFRPDNASASATALKSGNDLNCGNAYRDLNQAIARGDISEAVLDQALIRLFTARERLGTLHASTQDPYARIGTEDIDTPAHRALAQQAAVQSLVLLKNTGHTLPLTPGTTLAVVGPNADSLTVLEANYQGTSSAPVTPLTGLRTRFGTHHVHYAQGALLAPDVLGTIPDTALRSNGQPGLKGEYFDTLDLSGPPRLVRQDRLIAFNWDHIAPTKDMDPHRYAVRWTGELLPPGP